MAGVIGGLLGFGAVGLFVGPVVLAVMYTLVSAWVDEEHDPAATSKPGAHGAGHPDAR
jgi:predicted PurR-regulated permease PerM